MSEAKHKNNDRAIAQNRPVASVSGRLFVHSFLIYSAPKAGTFFARAFCRTDSGVGGLFWEAKNDAVSKIQKSEH